MPGQEDHLPPWTVRDGPRSQRPSIAGYSRHQVSREAMRRRGGGRAVSGEALSP